MNEHEVLLYAVERIMQRLELQSRMTQTPAWSDALTYARILVGKVRHAVDNEKFKEKERQPQ